MSQTLSLEPGKYSLFITPPVAGVDFTGTPTPSVSYQWRKNGTAIAGQDAATISGVWVEQSGGTVDLVDGDTISIDIILTNPVQVTTKTVSAVIDASIPAPTITPLSIRLVSAPTTPVSTIPNASIGSQIMVASTGSVSVVTTPPLLPTYQWRRGFAPIAGATSQTYTLQAADADSIVDCVVSVSNSGGTASSTASVIVGTVADAGWTTLTPAADSRLIYVSSEGDDVAAANVKGRGYYLPSDPEIGADPTNPVGPIVAYKSLWRAETRLRRTKYVSQSGNIDVYGGGYDVGSTGYPDWLLMRRGDTFAYSPEAGYGNSNWPYATGVNTQGTSWMTATDQTGGTIKGRSESEPVVVTAWGNPSDPRPIRAGNMEVGGWCQHIRYTSIDLTESLVWKGQADNFASLYSLGIWLEDCRMRSAGSTNSGSFVDCRLRRCVITGNFSATSHNQGIFLANHSAIAASGWSQPLDSWTIEECIFDRNGYKENPNDATTWTAGVVSPQASQAYSPGSGVQPLRSYFDRNIYVATGDGTDHITVTLRGNIFSRNGGGGSVQMRQGGVVDRNLFMWNDDAGFVQGGAGGIYKDNVILHDDHMLPPGGWGKAFGMWNEGSLDAGPVYVMDANTVTHFHRSTNGPSSLYSRGGVSDSGVGPNPSGTQLAGSVSILNNAVYRSVSPRGISVESNTLPMVSISGNQVAVLSGSVIGGSIGASEAAGGLSYEIDGNLYHSQSAAPFGSGLTFAQWQALRTDLDDSSSFYSDFSSFKAAAGWTAPERDIVSYMESVDPTYVVDENVYVDEDAAVKQASRQKVWEVLVNNTAWPGAMTEAQAKLTARRYHAFITFIQRAKENRKGAWDPRWTAEAVSNYIRAGFGKTAVTGAYDSRSLADRLSDYTT
jgi:hypothetical protein